MSRNKPNVLITGTPGVGKSRISTKVCKLTGLKYVNISQFAISNKLILEHDSERDCDVIDDVKVISKLKKKIETGGFLVDYHTCDFFPHEWFDKVFVLRVDNSVLHSRLKERNYSDSKISENIECEIFQVTLEEAYETFERDVVMELVNDNKKQLKRNIKVIVEEVESFQRKVTVNNSDD